MAGSYSIRPLPNSSIVEGEKVSRNGYTIPYFEIRNGTFDDIHQSLKIRPKAALFARRSQSTVYVVIHNDSDAPQCLFLFEFISTSSKEILHICRCLGKNAVKKHWEPFLFFLYYMS